MALVVVPWDHYAADIRQSIEETVMPWVENESEELAADRTLATASLAWLAQQEGCPNDFSRACQKLEVGRTWTEKAQKAYDVLKKLTTKE